MTQKRSTSWFGATQHRIFCSAQRITRNREDAEDVTQESFHRAYLHLKDFEERSRFSTWLTRIAINESLLLLRRRRARAESLTEGFEDGLKPLADAFIDNHPGPELSCWHQERSEILGRAIDKLSPQLRKTVWARGFEDMSITETARILRTSITTVKARLHHGRRKLRRLLDRELVRGGRQFRSAGSRLSLK